VKFGVVEANNILVVANRTTDFSLNSNNSWADLPCGNVILNRGNLYNSSNFIFTVNKAGIYKISCHFTLITVGGTPPTSLRAAAGYLLNGTTDNFLASGENFANYVAANVTTFRNLSVGNTLRPRLFYVATGGSGFTVNLMGVDNSPVFAMERMT
jgi:hypothetical protein